MTIKSSSLKEAWEKTNTELATVYATWRTMPAAPKRTDPEWESWDALMKKEVRDPAAKLHAKRIEILITSYKG